MKYVELEEVVFEATQIQEIVRNVQVYQYQSINALKVSFFNATQNITQYTMQFAADILALGPRLEEIQIGTTSTNDFYFDVTTYREVDVMEI